MKLALVAPLFAALSSVAICQQSVGFSSLSFADLSGQTTDLLSGLAAPGGRPGTLRCEFPFSLAPGSPLPRAFDVRWRLSHTGGTAVSVYSFELADGSYLPKDWYGDRDGSGEVTLLRYKAGTGNGRMSIDVPVLQDLESRLFPALAKANCIFEVSVGGDGQLSVDHANGTVSGALFEGSASFPVVSPGVVVFVPRLRPAPLERCSAFILLDESRPTDTTFQVAGSNGTALRRLPSSVTIPAGERVAQVGYFMSWQGTEQVVLTDELGDELGASPTISVGPRHDLYVRSNDFTMAVGALPGEPTGAFAYQAHIPYGQIGAMVEHSTIPSWAPNEDNLMPHLEAVYALSDDGCGGYYDWPEDDFVCIPAVGYLDKDTRDKCGECKLAPLSEADKPHCESERPFYRESKCIRLCPRDSQHYLRCYYYNGIFEQFLTKWFAFTGSRGEYDCFSAEVSFGELVAAAFGVEFNMSCCTYQWDGTYVRMSARQCRTTGN